MFKKYNTNTYFTGWKQTAHNIQTSIYLTQYIVGKFEEKIAIARPKLFQADGLKILDTCTCIFFSDAIWWHRSGSTLAQVMACCLMAPSHYLNQCLLSIYEVLWLSHEGKFHRNCSYQSMKLFDSLWPSDTIWRHKSWSTLAQVMAWYLMAPSHYLNQCWLIISKVQWHPSESNFTTDASAISHWN